MEKLLDKLDVQSYILEFKKPFERLPKLTGYKLERINERSVLAEVPAEFGIHGLFEVLAMQGMEVVGLRNAANRLEQFFMNLVDARRNDSSA
jgi:ABC-2 type transport system ATP-binding protein